jgi:hypothetical protein
VRRFELWRLGLQLKLVPHLCYWVGLVDQTFPFHSNSEINELSVFNSLGQHVRRKSRLELHLRFF